MRFDRPLLSASALAFLGGAALWAQQPPPPPPQTPQQPPVFRTEIDVIRLDVSVLDKDRRPVRGLTAEDFTVFESGKAQRIVAVSEVEAVEHDPAPSAWMRHVPRDIATNDLIDQVGDGRVFAIVMDDWNIPWDDTDIIMAARSTARYIIDSLGPSDVAAVIYPQEAGRTQDFTSDRMKLLRAIDQFDPKEKPFWIPPTPTGPGPGGGDMPQRFSPSLMRTQCQRMQPTVPTIDTTAGRLATIPNRRKTMILVSTGIPLSMASSGRGCDGELSFQMKRAFVRAREGNINIYTIDPAGYGGYADYLQRQIRRGGRPAWRAVPAREAEGAARIRRDFLEITADNTGARAVVGSEGIEDGIDRIFSEDGSYYLVGYQTSNGKPDNKFRRIEVKVNRKDVTVRTRSGYWAMAEGSLESREEKEAPDTQNLGLTGLMGSPNLPLRASVVPLDLAAADGRDANCAVVLTLRAPPTIRTVSEPLFVVHNVYDATGSPGAPVQHELPLTLYDSGDDTRRFDAFAKITLPPGRYEIRLNALSRQLDKNGTVFAEVEVPDFTRPGLSMSAVALGTPRRADDGRAAVLSALLPIVPTSARDFVPGDTVTSFFRVFQGGDAPLAPVTLQVMLLDMTSKTIVDRTETIAVESFAGARSATHQIDLPLNGLKRGPHVFSVTAKLLSGPTVRRDVVFRIR